MVINREVGRKGREDNLYFEMFQLPVAHEECGLGSAQLRVQGRLVGVRDLVHDYEHKCECECEFAI
jgi:hypothetical protein